MKKSILSVFVGLVVAPAFGTWVDVTPSTDFDSIKSEITVEALTEGVISDEDEAEFMISDYESESYPFTIGEYDDMEDLVDMVEQLESFSDEEADIITTIMHDLGYSLEEAVEIVQDSEYIMYSGCNNMTDVAYQVVEDCGYLEQIPENLRYYFGYESFGRDLDIERTFIYTNSGIVEIIR